MRDADVADPAISRRSALLRALRPPLPREHGTWAWLLLPAGTGLLAIARPSLPGWLFFSGMVLAFFLRAAVESWRASKPRQPRFLVWALVLGIAVHGTAVPPLAHWDRWILLPLGAGIAAGPLSVAGIRLLRVRWRVLGEAAIVGSLSLVAPAVAYAGTGDFDRWTAFLWLPVALHLWGGITYVRLSLAPASPRAVHVREERRRTAALYHAALPFALAAAVAGGAMPALATLAYIPMMAKVLYGLWRDRPVDRVQTLGIGEAVHAAAFGALLVTLYRLAA